MAPKEKAKELYDKYEFVYIQNYTSKHEVKECALIVVNYMLDEARPDEGFVYWQEVRDEINKL